MTCSKCCAGSPRRKPLKMVGARRVQSPAMILRSSSPELVSAGKSAVIWKPPRQPPNVRRSTGPSLVFSFTPGCAGPKPPRSHGVMSKPLHRYRGALTIRVRTSKTNRAGEETDIRLVKNGPAAALTAMRPNNASPTALVFRGLNGHSIGRRFAAAAKAAGIEGVTAHSGRVGLASELTAAGASTTETMLAGGWKTSRMVAHYSAGASAERGAVAKYL